MTERPQPALRVGVTIAIVVAALVAVLFLWSRHRSRPSTYHAVVHADVVQVAPRVSGPVVEVGFEPNQDVEAGDMLYVIDPEPYEGKVTKAQANLDQVRADQLELEARVVSAEAAVRTADVRIIQAEAAVEEAKATYEAASLRLKRLEEIAGTEAVAELVVDEARGMYGSALAGVKAAEAGVVQARAASVEARAEVKARRAAVGPPGDANPRVRVAKEQLHHAELDLGYTRVLAPVDGTASETLLDLGAFAGAGRSAAAIVDTSSFRIRALFKETQLSNVRKGDRALITLMGWDEQTLEGVVSGFAPGIGRLDETGERHSEGLPRIQPTFDWVRLAQRIPVDITLIDPPPELPLIVGASAAVTILAQERD